MKSKILFALVAITASFNWQAVAQIYDTNNVIVQTFAGSGFFGYVDGQGTQTMFNNPRAVVIDSSSNLFVLDSGNSRIRKITPDGTVSTFAGGGGGSLPGYGTNVSLGGGNSGSMTIDHSNTLWFAHNQALWRIGSDAYVSKTNLGGFDNASGLCVDSGNNLYFSDHQGNKIYRYRTNGVLEVFAGSGNSGSADGNGIFTSFYFPAALAVDAADNVYVWDSGNYLIRRINQNRDVVTVTGKCCGYANSDGTGTNAAFLTVSAMCVDNSGNVILASGPSGAGSCVRRMTTTTNILTLAGSFSQVGYTNGTGFLARFRNTSGVCVSQGGIFVADAGDHRIRNLTFSPSTQPVLPSNLQLNTYPGLQITGTVGRTYQVQSSSDVTNWTTQATLLLTSSPFLWLDQNPVIGNKFYRALLLP